jgi:uncharacterized membrane protein
MADTIFMDAEIRPNRSLSKRGFVVLISVVTAANLACAALFLAMGAWFVPMFLGLDVLAVAFAFKMSFAKGRQVERVQVTDRAVRITRESPRHSQVVWESPTAFTRVSVIMDDDQPVDLRVALSGKQTHVARALGSKERAEFARALDDAIRAARRARG